MSAPDLNKWQMYWYLVSSIFIHHVSVQMPWVIVCVTKNVLWRVLHKYMLNNI